MTQVNPFHRTPATAPPEQDNPFANAAPPPVAHRPQMPDTVADISLDDEAEAAIPQFAPVKEGEVEKLRAWVSAEPFDSDQRSVVELPAEGVIKNPANAGSGKTKTGVGRAINLTAGFGVDPRKQVLITFTNRAAREIKDRYKATWADVTGNKAPPMPFIGTLHSLAYSTIHMTEGSKQTILGEGAGRTAFKRLVIGQLYPEDKEKHDRGLHLRTMGVMDQLYANNEMHLFCMPVWTEDGIQILDHAELETYTKYKPVIRYLDCTSRTITMMLTGMPREFIPKEAPEFSKELKADIRGHYATEAGWSVPEFTALLKSFLTLKYTQRTFQFTDIIYYPLCYLLQHEHQLAQVRNKYQYVFQDEAQDQDTLQYALIRLICGPKPNLLFCADTKQTLYFWRQARPDLTEHLDRVMAAELPFPNGEICPPQPVTERILHYNYRSKQQLVELANLFAEGFVTKAAEPSKAHHGRASDVLSIRVFENSHQENKHIALDIAQKVRSGARKYDDFAVITRTNKALLDLEAAFIAEQIPYHLKHDNRATTKQSTFRVLAAMYAVTINPRDAASFAELLEPIKGLGDKHILRLQGLLMRLFQANQTLDIFSLTPEILAQGSTPTAQILKTISMIKIVLEPLKKQIESEKFRIPEVNIFLKEILTTKGFYEGQEKIPGSMRPFEWQFSETAIQKVMRTLDSIYWTLEEDADFANQPESDKVAMIHAMLSLGSDDKEPDDIDDDPTANKEARANKIARVTLSTGHAFKGKQAKEIYGCNLRSLAPNQADPDEEQRCWHYVLFTRAEEKLTLTCSQQMPDFKGQMRGTRENPYLDEYIMGVNILKSRNRQAAAQ